MPQMCRHMPSYIVQQAGAQTGNWTKLLAGKAVVIVMLVGRWWWQLWPDALLLL